MRIGRVAGNCWAARTEARKYRRRGRRVLLRKVAFTIVEVLAVIAIIVIVYAISLPVLARARESGRQAACISRLKQIHNAMSLYSTDNGNLNATGLSSFPTRNPRVLQPYGITPEMAICPDSAVKPPSTSYIWQIFGLGSYDGRGPDLNAEAERLTSSFRAVICPAHDEFYYAPREQDIDYMLQKAFTLSLLASGSVIKERGVVPRLPPRKS